MKEKNENKETLIDENKDLDINNESEDEIDIFSEIEERRRNNKRSIYYSQTTD